jgi:hypothetical protein
MTSSAATVAGFDRFDKNANGSYNLVDDTASTRT